MDFEAIYREGPVPWDIGTPQPAVAGLEAAGLISGDVLDAGCGTGETALFLAGKGYRVAGFDGAPTAIESARRKAAERGLDVEFAVADATELAAYRDRFDTVIDSGLLHCLPKESRAEYVAELRRACHPEATVHVLCFADDAPEDTPRPDGLTEVELRELFSDGWTLTRLSTTEVLGVIPPGYPQFDAVPRDEHGRARMPGWLVSARQRP